MNNRTQKESEFKNKCEQYIKELQSAHNTPWHTAIHQELPKQTMLSWTFAILLMLVFIKESMKLNATEKGAAVSMSLLLQLGSTALLPFLFLYDHENTEECRSSLFRKKYDQLLSLKDELETLTSMKIPPELCTDHSNAKKLIEFFERGMSRLSSEKTNGHSPQFFVVSNLTLPGLDLESPESDQEKKYEKNSFTY